MPKTESDEVKHQLAIWEKERLEREAAARERLANMSDADKAKSENAKKISESLRQQYHKGSNQEAEQADHERKTTTALRNDLAGYKRKTSKKHRKRRSSRKKHRNQRLRRTRRH